jgi:hypothetical protein
MDRYQNIPSSRANNVPSNTRFVFFDRFLATAGLSVLHFLHYTNWWKLYYEWTWSVAGSQVPDRHVRFAVPIDIKLIPSKTETWGLRRVLPSEGSRILRFSKPDYSRIPPKVDCWRNIPKIGGDDKKVGGGVILRGWDVIVKTDWYLLEDLILFSSLSIYASFILIPWKCLSAVNLKTRSVKLNSSVLPSCFAYLVIANISLIFVSISWQRYHILQCVMYGIQAQSCAACCPSSSVLPE